MLKFESNVMSLPLDMKIQFQQSSILEEAPNVH